MEQSARLLSLRGSGNLPRSINIVKKKIVFIKNFFVKVTFQPSHQSLQISLWRRRRTAKVKARLGVIKYQA